MQSIVLLTLKFIIMKTLITMCFLTISNLFIAQTSVEKEFSSLLISANLFNENTIIEMIDEEEDEAVLEMIVEEEDEAFDFDHKAYLPKGFNAYGNSIKENEAVLEMIIEEEDEAFDFDHTDYLPKGFSINQIV